MADVRLYIYNSKEKGKPISLLESGELLKEEVSVVDSSEKKDDVTVKTTKTTKVTHKISITLTKLDYSKKVYEPCVIHAYLQVSAVQKKTDIEVKTITTDKDGKDGDAVITTDSGSYEYVTLPASVITDQVRGAKACLIIDNHTVAENYFVYNVLTRYEIVSNETSRLL